MTSEWRTGEALGRIVSLARELVVADYEDRPEVTSPDKAAEVIGDLLAPADREVALVVSLDTKHRVLAVDVLSVGSVDHTFMVPREVFRDALLANASAVVIAHSHPSGDPEPSSDDERITRRLVNAGEVVGIDVLDHLIFGRDRWTSLARRGVI